MRRPFPASMLAVTIALTPALHAAGLTAPDPLAKAYDLILDAQFDQIDGQLQRACGPAPPTSCEVLRAVSQYWQLLFDPENTGHDQAVLRQANAAIASAEGWVAREPKRAEAWFYLGGAYGTRVLLRDMRGDVFAAARDGKRIHDALQQAVKLDPTLQDAYFGLGLYHYYAAIAPRVARILGWLLFLPGGDRAGGLREMQQTQTQGMLLSGEADYQLHLIYLWYENRPMDALRLAEGLHRRYPHNPLFALRLATIQGENLHAAQASLETYRALLEASREGRVAYPAIAEVDARLGMADQLNLLCESASAIEQLHAVIALKPAAPYAAGARAYYRLGVVYDRIGRRDEAVTAYRSGLAAIPTDDRLHLGAKVREGIARTPIGRACR
ncbi:MAG TPA: hypothetical protein VGZ27_13175 [Vicinamibacterales bacterium]|jgi:tetratricopeptide (TPR) repeat protein|nr:hypothetical protein [Vicinamibacterales bacterium]